MKSRSFPSYLARIAVVVSVAATSTVHAASVDVAFSPHGGAEVLVLRTIASSQKSIHLLGYSFTAAPVVRALLEAKHRGVDVAVTGEYRSNIEQGRSGKARAAPAALVNASIPVRIVSIFPDQRSKYLVVDEQTIETGSYNYSQQAARFNSENVLVVTGEPVLARAYLANWREVSAAGEPYVPR
jgi:phosphatidylserine/phosphatidylglycerophosphate/cardiolipin synthase-like enzyme